MKILMVEIIVTIIVVSCIIYIFKGDFTRKNVGVTVIENLPLSIFKKWGKQENSVKEFKAIKKEVSVKTKNIKVNNDINKINKKVLEEVAIDKLAEETKQVEFISEIKNIDEVNNYSENTFDELINDDKEVTKDKEVIEIIQDEDNVECVINEKQLIDEEEQLVYWTPNGKSYHSKNTCRTLARSKVINSGTVSESGKDFKCEHCK